jgi:hypothetical protein
VKPLLWVAIGSGAVVGLILLERKARAAPNAPGPSPTPPPNPIQPGESVRVALAVPSGWRRVTGTEVSALPELGVRANTLRNSPGFTSMPYGTLAPFTASDGKTYATWVEQHFHEPGGPVKPWGLHHGVTLLAET